MDNKEELMKTYLLFLYSFFETHEDAENFSFDVLGKCPVVKKVRFIKEESSKNLIIIFESDFTKKEISEEFRKILTEETIKFYFLFDRNNIASANLPVQMKEFMFKPQEENVSLRLEYDDPIEDNSQTNMDLDTILEKLSEFGIESLTRNEKKFLDNFKN
jgi:hypothetical protein